MIRPTPLMFISYYAISRRFIGLVPWSTCSLIFVSCQVTFPSLKSVFYLHLLDVALSVCNRLHTYLHNFVLCSIDKDGSCLPRFESVYLL